MSASVFRRSEAKLTLGSLDLAIRCVCFVLFSTLVRPVCSQSPTTDIPTTTVYTTRVYDQSFSDQLTNPCSLVNASALHRDALDEQSLKGTAVIDELKSKALFVKENAENILETNVLPNCSMLQLPAVAMIPSADEISDRTPLDALCLFYKSLLNHTAYMYFIPEQLYLYSEDGCASGRLSENITSLAYDMRDLLCVLRLGIFRIQGANDDSDSLNDYTEQILAEQLHDQPICSRRSLRDCQVVASAVALLRNLYIYVQTTVFVGPLDSTLSSVHVYNPVFVH